MSTRLFVLGALVSAAAFAAPADAQRSRRHQPWERRSNAGFSVGIDGVYSTVGEHARDARIGDGVGFDAHAGIGVSALMFSGGYQRTRHDFEGSSSRATYSTIYAEPRVLLDLGAGNFTPYVVGRVGRTRVELPPGALTSTTDHMDGTTYGAGGGVQVWLARSVALDLGAMWSRLDYGKRKSASDVLHDAESGATFRAGLRLTP